MAREPDPGDPAARNEVARVGRDRRALRDRDGANLARGLGLVFNPGERIEGYTAPTPGTCCRAGRI